MLLSGKMVRKKRVASEILHRKLDSVCLDTRAKAEEEFKVRFQQFKVRFQLALDTKDTAQLCELLEGPGDSQAYDVDVQRGHGDTMKGGIIRFTTILISTKSRVSL